MVHSLNVYLSLIIGINNTEEIPVEMKQCVISGFRFVLVIRNADRTWIPELSEALTARVRSISSIWNTGNVVVMNESTAIKSGLAVQQDI